MSTWKWFVLWMRVKPLLHKERIEDVIRALEERATTAVDNLNREQTMRKNLEEGIANLTEEKSTLLNTLESNKAGIAEYLEMQTKLNAQKNDVEAQLNVSFFSLCNMLICPFTLHVHVFR